MRWVVFTNVYVAVCGAALTSATYTLLGRSPRLDAVSGLVFCATLVVYNLDRLVEPRPGDSVHERWIDRHRQTLWLLTGCAALGSLLFVTQLSRPALISLLPAGAVSIGYCLPVLPGARRWRRLKEVPGAKLVLIAGIWTYATAGLPMLAVDAELDLRLLAVLGARFCFLAAVALPFDLPDMQRDRQSGIVTLPTQFGVKVTRRIAWLLALLAGVMALFNPLPAAAAVIISCAATLGLIAALREDRGVFYFMVALDGMLLIQAALLWLIASA